MGPSDVGCSCGYCAGPNALHVARYYIPVIYDDPTVMLCTQVRGGGNGDDRDAASSSPVNSAHLSILQTHILHFRINLVEKQNIKF